LENAPTPFKLVIFDLDGVLVPIDSSWQYVHEAFGHDNEENYRRHLRGEIDFQEFMRSDIALWDGASIETIQAILDRVPVADGAREMIQTLHENRIRTTILSSGISLLADRIGRELGMDRVHANKLIADDRGLLTGEGVGAVPLKEKHIIIRKILGEEKLSPQECAIVGDSIFDLPRFRNLGITIAFNPKGEELELRADVSVRSKDLRALLPWLTSGPPNRIVIRLATGSREAESVVTALSPDNIEVPKGLYVKVFRRGRSVYMKMVSARGLGTLLATVDDMLSCAQVAISSIDVVKSPLPSKTI